MKHHSFPYSIHRAFRQGLRIMYIAAKYIFAYIPPCLVSLSRDILWIHTFYT
nr:MAG TPA: hypothetical protein [Bacteriophage sp.]